MFISVHTLSYGTVYINTDRVRMIRCDELGKAVLIFGTATDIFVTNEPFSEFIERVAALTTPETNAEDEA